MKREREVELGFLVDEKGTLGRQDGEELMEKTELFCSFPYRDENCGNCRLDQTRIS